ncbi:MAG: hypothetical protein M5U34_02155 [Chloroflexi bacterium]|nr:hypothetical protein [Chloroflexota bacterium]
MSLLTNLSEHDWWRIETMRLSPLYVSVHVTDWEMRKRFLRNAKAPDILPQLNRLAQANIAVHTQLVIVAQFNDGEWMERSIRDLAELWPTVQSISIVPAGLTRHHKYSMRVHTREEAAATLDYIEKLRPEFKRNLASTSPIPPTNGIRRRTRRATARSLRWPSATRKRFRPGAWLFG